MVYPVLYLYAMIKARELRPGNYFTEGTTRKRVSCVDRLGNITCTEGIKYSANLIKGIPLNDDLIAACNFNKREWYQLIRDGNNAGYLLFANDGNNRTFLTTVFALHELQNIYLDIEKKILHIKFKQ